MAGTIKKRATLAVSEITSPAKSKRVKREIPTEISIGGHTLKVIKQKKLIDQAEAYGIFDSDALTITIDASISESLAWETFWHEVIEALNHFAEANMEHKSIQVFGLLLHQIYDSMQQ